MYHLDSAVLFSPAVTHGGAIIRRAIVNKDYFKIFICLPDYAFYTLVKIFFDLVDRNDNADKLGPIQIILLPFFSAHLRILSHTASGLTK